MAKHGHTTANRNVQGKRESIQRWLMQEQYSINEAQAPNATWIITATNDLGHVIVVGQPSHIPDQLVLQANLQVDDLTHKQIAALAPSERQELAWDIKFGLLNCGVDFSGVDDVPKMILISQRIYDDGLTKDAFLQRVSQVRRALLTAMWLIGRKLQTPPSGQNMGFSFGEPVN